MNNKGYQELQVYQEAHTLVLLVYKSTRGFPKHELFGLISQMRRAASSVPANILEGYGRRSRKEFRRFLMIAQGSLTELEYYLELSRDLEYLSDKDYSVLEEQRRKVGALLGGFIRSFEI